MAEQVIAYCVKEKAKKPMKDVTEVTFNNGKHALQGICTSCGTKLTRFLSDKEVEAAAAARANTGDK